MLDAILGWILKSRGIKIGAGVFSGGGILFLIFNLNAQVSEKIKYQELKQREYVLLVIEPIKTEINNLKLMQRETKDMVRDIHNYLLKSKSK